MALKDKIVNLEDLKVVGDAVGDLKTAIGDYRSDLFELGNITTSDSSIVYTNIDSRVRTKNGVTLFLPAGAVIGMSDYTDAKFRWWRKESDGTYTASDGWLYADYTVSTAGDYVVLLCNITEKAQTDISALLNLFFGYSISDKLNQEIAETYAAIDAQAEQFNAKIDSTNSAKAYYDVIKNSYWMYTGVPGAYNGWDRTGFMPCTPGEILCIYCPVATTYNIFFKSATNGDKSDIKDTFALAVGNNEITVPSDAHYYGLSNTTVGMAGTYIRTLTTYAEFVESLKDNSIGALNPKETVGQRIIQSARRTNIWNAQTQPANPLVLSILTDLHGDANNLARFISYSNEYSDYIDGKMSLGDMVTAKYSDDFNFWLNTSGSSSIMCAIGNHDVWLTGLATSENADKVDVYAKYLKPNIASWSVTQPTNAETLGLNYWYKDYSTKGIRLIVLDCMYWDSTQKTWFEDALTGAITNSLQVIAVEHYDPSKNLTDIGTNFLSLDYGYTNLVTGSGSAEMITCVDTFITNGGTFVCWLSGDAHYDAFGVYTAQSGNKQLCLTFENAGCADGWNDSARISGQKSQDSFNIVAVDAYSKLVKIVRVGNNMDRNLRQKNIMTYNYNTHTLVTTE